jgi:transposase
MRAVCMSTVAVIRCNPILRAFADRLKAARKPTKVAIVACMRKLPSIMKRHAQVQLTLEP